MGEQLKTATGEMNITAWDALLLEVRRASYRVMWVDQRIELVLQKERELSHEVDEGTKQELADELRRWLAESRKERILAARVSKATIDAGLAEMVVRGIQLQAEGMSLALGAALSADGIELTDEQKKSAARAFIAKIEDLSVQHPTVMGELVGEHDE